MDYLHLYHNLTLNQEYWLAKLADGSVIECGFGYVLAEFGPLTYAKMVDFLTAAQVEHGELDNIPGVYTFDGATTVVLPTGQRVKLETLYEEEHPMDDSFVLVPLADLVEIWWEPRPRRQPLFITTS